MHKEILQLIHLKSLEDPVNGLSSHMFVPKNLVFCMIVFFYLKDQIRIKIQSTTQR